MKDLDFDELDKAVNSLMADVPPQTPVSKPDEQVDTVTLPDSAASDVGTSSEMAVPNEKPLEASPNIMGQQPVEEAVAVVAPVASVDSTSTSKEVAAPSLATKRSGRFMDVVHPSSDMRRSGKKLVSRSASSIAPLNPEITPEESPKTDEPAVESPLSVREAPAPLSADAIQTPTPTTDTAWPDPIDVHEQQQATENADDTPSAETSPEQASTPEVPAEVLSADSNEPSSPFLPDMKVEKRPLGGNDVPVSENDGADISTKTAQDPLPAELNHDILAIESSGAALAPATNTVEATSQKVDVDKSELDVTPLEGGATEPAPAPSGPVSIAQQYKAEASTGDQSHTPLYDNAADVHALTHPAKKKSGLWIILGIILLIVIGAGVGAFVYFQGNL